MLNDTKLIRLVKKNKILYDPNEPKHSQFDAREVVWQKIAHEMKQPVSTCKTHWDRLRYAYRKKLRQRAKNQGGSKKWKYEDELQFLRKYFRDLPNTESMVDDKDTDIDYNASDDKVAVTDDKVPLTDDEVTEMNNCDIDVPSLEEFASDASDDETQVTDSTLTSNDLAKLKAFLNNIKTTLKTFSPELVDEATTEILELVQEYELKNQKIKKQVNRHY